MQNHPVERDPLTSPTLTIRFNPPTRANRYRSDGEKGREAASGVETATKSRNTRKREEIGESVEAERYVEKPMDEEVRTARVTRD